MMDVEAACQRMSSCVVKKNDWRKYSMKRDWTVTVLKYHGHARI